MQYQRKKANFYTSYNWKMILILLHCLRMEGQRLFYTKVLLWWSNGCTSETLCA